MGDRKTKAPAGQVQMQLPGLPEQEKRFPVYTKHAEEVRAVLHLVIRMLQSKDLQSNETAVMFLRGLYVKMLSLLDRLDAGKDRIVYVSFEEREDVKRVAGLVGRHPELMQG